jgi:signal transduction histidine kinase/CheY-like chemotaxis protein
LAALRMRGPLAGNPRAETLHALALGTVCWTILSVLVVLPSAVGKPAAIGGDAILAAASLLALVLLRGGWFPAAAGSFLIGNVAMATVMAVLSGGALSPAVAFYLVVPISAAWLFGLNASLWASMVCLGCILALALLEQRGVLAPESFPGTPLGTWAELLRACLISAAPVAWLLRNFQSSLVSAESVEAALRTQQTQWEELMEQRTQELAEARHEAATANRAKDLFLANTSHELRTPLNAILGFSTLVRDDPTLSEKHRRDLEIVNRSGEHLLTLIDQVLDAARIEVGGIVPEIAPVRLRDILQESMHAIRMKARPKHLELMLEAAPDLPEVVGTDGAKLRQILVELISNAVKHTDRGSVTLRVAFRPPDQGRSGWGLFEISDTGIGISPRDAAGLGIVHNLVHVMGGTLQIEGGPGTGSTFRVEIPLEEAEEIKAANTSSARRVLRLAPDQPEYRILIVEDKRENWMLLQRLLLVAGFQVQVAEDGASGVEKFRSWRPHLIWMDMRLPGLDGPETARYIRTLEGGPEVKIVALTASAYPHQRADTLAAGMDDFLRKPYRRHEILDCIARHLGVRYAEDAAEPGTESEIAPEISPASLAQLPHDLRRELASAIVTLETNRVADLIERISELDGSLGELLSRCASRFAYTEIFHALTGQGGEGAHGD